MRHSTYPVESILFDDISFDFSRPFYSWLVLQVILKDQFDAVANYLGPFDEDKTSKQEQPPMKIEALRRSLHIVSCNAVS